LVDFHRFLPAFYRELIDVIELESLTGKIVSYTINPNFACVVAGD
jgi:hypothetical protein